MKYRRRIFYSTAQQAEIWDRWQRGESMNSIGRRFDRQSSSVFSVISPTGGIRPACPSSGFLEPQTMPKKLLLIRYGDPISFRTEYEERYRSTWDRGEDGFAEALILQLRGTDLNALPWGAWSA